MKKLLLNLFLLAGLIGLPCPHAGATINSLINKNIYSGNGSNTAWSYTFPIVLSSDIQIYTIDNLGNQVQVVSNYSINTGTAIVTYPVTGSPLASGWQIILLRVEPLNQQLSLSNQGNLPAKSLEAAYDKLTMEVQQINEVQSRSVVGSLDSNTTLSLPSPISGDLLGWDTNDKLVNISNPSITAQWTLNGANISYNIGNVSTTQNFSANNISLTGLLSGNINWPEVTNLLTHANVNWNDFNMQALLNSGGANWNDINIRSVLNSGGINWNDINAHALLNHGGVNWSDTNIFTTGKSSNIGIGSSNPGVILDVNGTTRSTSFNVNGYASIIGSWVSKSNGSIYQATTDGFLIGYGANTDGGSLAMLTDSNSTPSTTRCSQVGLTASSGQMSVTPCITPVRKGDYYEASGTGVSFTTLYWIPIGS